MLLSKLINNTSKLLTVNVFLYSLVLLQWHRDLRIWHLALLLDNFGIKPECYNIGYVGILDIIEQHLELR